MFELSPCRISPCHGWCIPVESYV